MNLIREEIEGFEKRYEMSSEEFLDKFEQGELGMLKIFLSGGDWRGGLGR